MKTKILCSIILLAITGMFASGQQYAVDKGAKLISGMASFSSQGGDLYLYSGEKRISTLTLTPSFNGFIAKNIFLGGGMALVRTSQGNSSISALEIGPTLGIAAGDSTSTAFPYFDMSLRYCVDKGSSDTYLGSSKQTGTDFVLSAGLIVQLRPHCGLVFEVGYNMLKLKDDSSKATAKGNIITVGLGLVGLMY